MSLKGKTVLITGGGTGLGPDMARGFAGAGAAVWIAGRTAATLEGVAARRDEEGALVLAGLRLLRRDDRDTPVADPAAAARCIASGNQRRQVAHGAARHEDASAGRW